MRVWSHDLDSTTDQRFGHLLSSLWCYGHCPARNFPAAPLDLLLGTGIFWVGGTLFDECNTSITTSQIKSRDTVHSQSCSQWNNLWFLRTVRHWRLLLAHPTSGSKCMTFTYAQCSTWGIFWVTIIKFTRKLISSLQGHQQNLSLGTDPIDNAGPCYPRGNVDVSLLCDECMKLILPVVGHKLVSIWWLIGQLCSIECQVYQFVQSTSISIQSVSTLLIISNWFKFLLLDMMITVIRVMNTGYHTS